MCSELPKEFQKTSEVLPFPNYGLSTLDEFKETEKEIQHLEWLKKVGLSEEEIKLYQENEAGILDQKTKIESNALKEKLEVLYGKINDYQNNESTPTNTPAQVEASTSADDNIKKAKKSECYYSPGHPINDLKKIEEDLFGHLQDKSLSITKRRKVMRRLERKREKLLAQQKSPGIEPVEGPSQIKPGSLWDVQKMPDRRKLKPKKPIGPYNKTMYTVKDNKIVRLEPTENEEEYNAVDIVVPVNPAEQELLEGTQMKIDDIRKMERFKDYEPGIPSKVLFLKNIAPTLKHEQLAILFNQFQMENGRPVDLKLMTGRMHGQAFATFQKEHVAIQALAEINGTILGGQPIIAQFGRNSNRIQVEENR